MGCSEQQESLHMGRPQGPEHLKIKKNVRDHTALIALRFVVRTYLFSLSTSFRQTRQTCLLWGATTKGASLKTTSSGLENARKFKQFLKMSKKFPRLLENSA